MKKVSVTIMLAAMLAGCAHRQATVNPAPAKRHAVHKVAAMPVVPPVAAPVPAPVVQVAPPPPASVVEPAPKPAEKKNAWRWIYRDRSTNGGK